jgi:class 3 adenylate cyclase
VLEKLQQGEAVDPETFEQVTLGFTAITDFAKFVVESSPLSVVEFLNGVFFMFDTIIEHFDVYKVGALALASPKNDLQKCVF